MKNYFENLAKALLGRPYNKLEADQKAVIESIAEGEAIAANVNNSFQEQLTFGQKLADRISTFGGSWTFILIFISILVIWMGINSFVYRS